MIRVLLCEDQAMVRGAIQALLSLEDDLQVIGTARDGQEALELLEHLTPDVLITDIEMPRLNGLELAALLRPRGVKALILTTFGRSGYLRRALEAGVRGFLLKDAPSSELAGAIRRIHAGGRAIDPALAAEAWDEADPLTERERQVLRLSEDGSSSAEIARIMQRSEGTVRNYLSEAMGKLGVKNRTEASRLARDRGWL